MSSRRKVVIFLGLFTASAGLLRVPRRLPLADAMDAAEERETAAQTSGFALRDGTLVQAEGCPQAISEEEAAALVEDQSWPGGVARLTKSTLDTAGRSGNHFVVLSRALSMAFCCKYKVLTLPGEDSQFPTDDGSRVQLPLHHFTFSSGGGDVTDVPTLPGAEDLPDRPTVCPPEREINGTYDFFKEDHDDLRDCMSRVFLLGCEAEYLRSVVGHRGEDEDFCSWGLEDGDGREGDPPTPSLSLNRVNGDDAVDGADVDYNGETWAGPLVVHIRSGDIFKPDREGWHGMIWYGQPPLRFYLEAMSSQPWTGVTVISNANGRDTQVNPTYAVLDQLSRQGLLRTDVTMLRDRPFFKDLRALLCAQNLVVARSSLTKLLLHHARARRFFVAATCDETLLGSTNMTAFCKYRPDAELYGIEWKTSSQEYSLYNNNWRRSDAQMLEMVLSDEIQSIRRCCTGF